MMKRTRSTVFITIEVRVTNYLACNVKSASSRYTLYSTIERLHAGKIAHEQSPLNDLTPRELEVLANIARGLSNNEIATVLDISEGTVKMHVSNILSKLHLTDRTQAAIYALQKRLVPLNEALDKEE